MRAPLATFACDLKVTSVRDRGVTVRAEQTAAGCGGIMQFGGVPIVPIGQTAGGGGGGMTCIARFPQFFIIANQPSFAECPTRAEYVEPLATV